MQKLKAEQEQSKFRLSRGVIIALFAIIAVLSIGRVAIANRLVDDSSRLKAMDQQITALEEQNNQLSEELREKSSITKLQAKATEEGFVKSKSQSYIRSQLPVAFNLPEGATTQ